MTLRTKVAEALRAELRRQADAPGPDAPWIADGAEFAFPASFVKIDGAIDLEALADAALERLRENDGARLLRVGAALESLRPGDPAAARPDCAPGLLFLKDAKAAVAAFLKD